jgi:hypothetical protein
MAGALPINVRQLAMTYVEAAADEREAAMNAASKRNGPIEQATQGYSDEPRPLKAYAALMGIFNLIFAAVLLAARRRNQPVPERIGYADIITLGVATHKASRLLVKDWVTSPIRAPFTTYEGAGQMSGEVTESPRGEGWRLAIGELVT